MNGETKVLNEIDLATMKEDKVCIERDHETGQLAWRFASPQADPLSLMVQVTFLQMMLMSGWAGRIEALERRVAELEGDSREGDSREGDSQEGDSRIAPTEGA